MTRKKTTRKKRVVKKKAPVVVDLSVLFTGRTRKVVASKVWLPGDIRILPREVALNLAKSPSFELV